MKATICVEIEDKIFSREIEFFNKEEFDLEMKKFQDDLERHAFISNNIKINQGEERRFFLSKIQTWYDSLKSYQNSGVKTPKVNPYDTDQYLDA